MSNVTRTKLFPGVHLTAVRTNQFKSAVLAVHLLTPLDRERAALHALVPSVLRRGTAAHPDMNSLSAALDELYGGSIEPSVRKKGETQCLSFVGSFLDDAYTLNGEAVLEPAADLLGQLLLSPCLENGAFVPAYVEGEKANLIDRIRGVINDKRQYAVQKMIGAMCADEAFGVSRLGDETHAAAITGESLWAAYQDLLHNAGVEFYYCGSAPVKRVKAALQQAFAALPVNRHRAELACQVVNRPEGAPRFVEEGLDVAQGKLVMGFRTDGITVHTPEYPALTVFNAVYGGTTTSKLFMNVREKLSLCYFASSGLEKQKGMMTVSSGIEFDKYEQAKSEILAQLEACRRGETEKWELEAAIRSIVSTLQTTMDSQGRLEDYWLVQAVAGRQEGPEELARRVEQVTAEDVAAVAGRVCLDTVYFLKGKEG